MIRSLESDWGLRERGYDVSNYALCCNGLVNEDGALGMLTAR